MTVSKAEIERAAQLLEEGGVVAFPTETVYGIGALATDGNAVERLFRIKGRPRDKALTVHMHDANGLDVWAERVPAYARALAEALWPGPITLVVPARASVLSIVTGGSGTVGLRVPDHPVTLQLLGELVERRGISAAIVGPSANKHGQPPPRTAAEVIAGLGAPQVDDDAHPDMVLDAGACPGGVPSTVLACDGAVPRVLRHGGTSVERIEEILGRAIERG